MSGSDVVCVVDVVEDLPVVWSRSEEEFSVVVCWLVSVEIFMLDSSLVLWSEEKALLISVLELVSEEAAADMFEFVLLHPAKEPANNTASMNAAAFLPICLFWKTSGFHFRLRFLFFIASSPFLFERTLLVFLSFYPESILFNPVLAKFQSMMKSGTKKLSAFPFERDSGRELWV